ncbi:MAG: phage portal protein, partial [Rhodospirillaceae bacterium]|nr:phage portal protein [Rhodospirillaceae bacterium]
RAVWHLAYLNRFDQYRGISPLAPALNTFQDVAENSELALVKAKIASMFGMIFLRKGAEAMQYWNTEGLRAPSATSETTVPEDPSAETTETDSDEEPKYPSCLTGQAFQLELDTDEDAKFLNADTPGTGFREFMLVTIQLALKCLDLPYVFFDEAHTNYYGSKAAVNQYEKSARHKRKGNQDFLRRWAYWRLKLMVRDGVLDLSQFGDGTLTVADLKFDWVPDGIPWIDMMKEVKGHMMAVEADFTSVQRVCRERGIDPKDVIREKVEHELAVGRARKDAGLTDTDQPAEPAEAAPADAMNLEELAGMLADELELRGLVKAA